jgi:hypothetical protein
VLILANSDTRFLTKSPAGTCLALPGREVVLPNDRVHVRVGAGSVQLHRYQCGEECVSTKAYDHGQVPSMILRAKNFEFGGVAFAILIRITLVWLHPYSVPEEVVR